MKKFEKIYIDTSNNTCPLCGEHGVEDPVAGYQLHLQYSSFYILSCKSCQIRWLKPVPSTEYLKHLYDEAYFESEACSYSYQKQIEQTSACFNNTAIAFYQKLKPQGSLLDVGCATGDFLLALRRIGLEGVGLELSSYAIEIAHKRGLENIIAGDLFTTDLDNQIFAGIHMSHVLEHLPDIHTVMRRVRNLLRNNGLIYIEVPYQFDSLLDRVNRYFRRGTSSFGPFSIHHCTFFTPKSLCNLLTQHGFEIISLTTYLPCRRTGRASSIRNNLLSTFLWLSDFFFQRGDVISVWAKSGSQ